MRRCDRKNAPHEPRTINKQPTQTTQTPGSLATCNFASVTQSFPGPYSLSTGAIDSVHARHEVPGGYGVAQRYARLEKAFVLGDHETIVVRHVQQNRVARDELSLLDTGVHQEVAHGQGQGAVLLTSAESSSLAESPSSFSGAME